MIADRLHRWSPRSRIGDRGPHATISPARIRTGRHGRPAPTRIGAGHPAAHPDPRPDPDPGRRLDAVRRGRHRQVRHAEGVDRLGRSRRSHHRSGPGQAQGHRSRRQGRVAGDQPRRPRRLGRRVRPHVGELPQQGAHHEVRHRGLRPARYRPQPSGRLLLGAAGQGAASAHEESGRAGGQAGVQQAAARGLQGARTGPLFDHVSSLSVARDLDALRAALGEGKLTYYGVSYGTIIGQLYAERFPQRVRALALDGNFDHSLGTAAYLDTAAVHAESSFDEFAAWCSRTPTCALYGRDMVWRDMCSSGP
ncbi:alpha/beta fold hydrolase [Nonomuraea recticatena]|uniref:alpha/beta fold hydrolase n=1 Tax=Nonomuraea recticatena TaxID=46178 RepID=UPI0031F86008